MTDQTMQASEEGGIPLPDTFDIMADLSAPFALWEHDYRKQGRGDDVTGYITFVGIERAIARFNSVLGANWQWTVVEYKVVGTTEKPAVIVHGRISYLASDGKAWLHRDGLGAAQWQCSADDLDKIIKSAMAEAFKKASHQFGMSGYLWDKGLADQIALELLREEGRPWDAKYRPKQPQKGNTAASEILAGVKASAKTVTVKPAPAKRAAAPGKPNLQAVPSPTPAVDFQLDPAWIAAFEALKGIVKADHPEAGPAAWTSTITGLIDGRFRTKSPRAVAPVDLQAFVAELQRERAPFTDGADPAVTAANGHLWAVVKRAAEVCGLAEPDIGPARTRVLLQCTNFSSHRFCSAEQLNSIAAQLTSDPTALSEPKRLKPVSAKRAS